MFLFEELPSDAQENNKTGAIDNHMDSFGDRICAIKDARDATVILKGTQRSFERYSCDMLQVCCGEVGAPEFPKSRDVDFHSFIQTKISSTWASSSAW